ncbi:MAG: hypothetical protein AMXMBFR36_21460 [Acidobacteriota bacterium]
MPTFDFEKLGAFYLGRVVDPASAEVRPEPLLYDSRDLVTHAAIVGMTGSGKTGLGVALLEEAAIDGVPALVVDPKGDLANLLLTFPELAPGDFLPWVRADDAERKGVTREALAGAEATKWREGLAAWGQDGARIRRLRDAAEVTLYTPGSDLARPISILASFAPPPAAVAADGDLFRDRVETAATSLLGLIGVAADPLRSREHILLSTLLSEAWRAGRSYDLAGLIADLQKPPVTRVGVLDLETFFPAADRFELALRINALLAAPGFDVWLRGDALDVGALLRTAAGKPRLAVISLAHLSDAERMFFVALLLNETVSWMRAQSGTSSLRAILYMDEVFGFLPPVAEPPSKKPMLLLLKQARAFGLGLVLATQNPVDLDYKALSNIGTWFLGRLQTERDKARVLDGLEGASASAGGGFDRAAIDRLLSGLRSRRFLLHNVHDEGPTLIETRWVMSYLAGPIDREGIRKLAGSAAPASPVPAPAPAPPAAAPSPSAAVAAPARTAPPVVPPGIVQVFLPLARGAQRVEYRPALLGEGRAHVESPRHGVAERIDSLRLALLGESATVDWIAAVECGPAAGRLAESPVAGATFAPLPARAARPDSYPRWEKALATALARALAVRLWRHAGLRETSRPSESERDFRARLADLAREARDAEVEKLRSRFEPKLATLDERIRRAEAKVEEQQQQASSKKLDTAMSIGATVLGALFGRRKLSVTTMRSASASARSAGRIAKETKDVELAAASLEDLRARRAELEAEAEASIAALPAATDVASAALEEIPVKPKKADVEVLRVALAWAPHDTATGEALWT